MDGVPDAEGLVTTFVRRSADAILEFDDDISSLSGTLLGGAVVPGTVNLQLINRALGDVDATLVDNGTGILQGGGLFGENATGQIDYNTGVFTVNWTARRAVVVNASYDTGTTLDFPSRRSIQLTRGYLREGEAWVFAYLDSNNNNRYDQGEPAGLADQQPVHFGALGPTEIKVNLSDSLPGYPRFGWDGTPDGVYTVFVTRTSSEGAPTVISGFVLRGRNYFHEGDLRYQNMMGLDPGSSLNPGYQWFANGESGLFSYLWSGTLQPPEPVEPVNDMNLTATRNILAWRMSTEAVHIRVLVRKHSQDGEVIYDSNVIPAPTPGSDGVYRMPMPLIAGDQGFTNGLYFWTIQALSPAAASSFSAAESFRIALSREAPGVHHVTGTLRYQGYAARGLFVVEAFAGPGLLGRPIARVVTPYAGDFDLHGLLPGAYFLKAYRDQNDNQRQDPGEPFGVLRVNDEISPHAKPGSFSVPPESGRFSLVIRDPDVNNDRISDAYQYEAGFGFWGSVEMGNGWYWSSWFNFYNIIQHPWVYHMEHQWLYHFATAGSDGGVYMWDEGLQAVWWTTSSIYPFVYNFQQGAWMYYEPGTTNPRWFFNYGTGLWEAH